MLPILTIFLGYTEEVWTESFGGEQISYLISRSCGGGKGRSEIPIGALPSGFLCANLGASRWQLLHSPLRGAEVKMRISCLLTLTLLSVSIAGTLALIEAPIERIDLPSGASNKRYLSDPMAHASVLYAGLLQIGGQNYRLILVRRGALLVELATSRLHHLERIQPSSSASVSISFHSVLTI